MSIDVLQDFLEKIPSIKGHVVGEFSDNGLWWIKFKIDIHHPLAWRVVQELGHILNYLSIEERLPTVFMPVSPPVYLNGGPDEFLSWLIESKDISFTPDLCKEWLEGRLPRPVEKLESWALDDENED
jgi:hypothetical protein